MKKKFYSFLSICLGGGIILLSLFLKEGMGNWFFVLFALGIIIFVVSVHELVTLIKKRNDNQPHYQDTKEVKAKPEYRRKKSLLTGAEIKLYNTLVKLFADRYLIVPQPALHTVIDKITQNSYRNELFRVCDFLLADKDNFAPILLIELNDSSHNRMDRIERDQKVNDICSAAKMPIVTIPIQDLNDPNSIKKSITTAIRRS